MSREVWKQNLPQFCKQTSVSPGGEAAQLCRMVSARSQLARPLLLNFAFRPRVVVVVVPFLNMEIRSSFRRDVLWNLDARGQGSLQRPLCINEVDRTVSTLSRGRLREDGPVGITCKSAYAHLRPGLPTISFSFFSFPNGQARRSCPPRRP